MNYWLMKSEPDVWSIDQQIKAGEKGADWDGVRNYQASNNMKKMKVGDLGFFYHSVKERRIIGIVKVIKEYYPDHTDKKNIFGMVDLVAVKKLNEFVTLDQIKNTKELLNMPLVKQSRLSVSPVSKAEWEIILKLGKTTI